MSVRTITAAELKRDMTILSDGQHHIVDAVGENGYGDVFVRAETVVGDMGLKTFTYEPDQAVSVLA